MVLLINLRAMCFKTLTLSLCAPSKHDYDDWGCSTTGISFFMIKSNPPTIISLPSSIPSKSIIVSTSSMRPHFNLQSKSVLAVIDGPPFTSISHGLKLLSTMKS